MTIAKEQIDAGYAVLIAWEASDEYDKSQLVANIFAAMTKAAPPVPLSQMTVPMLDAISEPCKGCGKRPVDFITG